MPTWPIGVETANILYGKGITSHGEMTSADLEIKVLFGGSTQTAVWDGDGTPLYSFKVSVKAGDGQIGNVALPVVNQPGWLDDSQNAYTMWGYELTEIPYYNKKAGIARTKFLQLLSGQSEIDFDRIPNGRIGLPISAPVVPVTSVNGQTGAVVVDGVTDESLTAIAADEDSDFYALQMSQIVTGAAGAPVAVSALIVPQGRYDEHLQTYNMKAGALRRFRAALARQRNGGAPAKIFCAGDSTTFGIGVTGVQANFYSRSYPARLLSLLPTRWGVARRGPAWAHGGLDPRLTFGSGWSVVGTRAGGAPNTAMGLGGGGALRGANATATPLVFTPIDPCDSLTIYYLSGPTTGTFSWSVDGGSATTVATTNPTEGVSKITVPAGVGGMHVLRINGVTGAVFIVGVGAQLSTNVGGIEFTWQGVSSTTTAYWANGSVAPFGSQNTLAQYKPDLLIVGLGLNDANTTLGGTAAIYKSNLAYIIDHQRSLGGDVLLIVPWVSDVASQADFAPYRAAAYQLCDEKDIALIDMGDRWPTPNATAVAEPYALMDTDHLHGTERGYWDMASAVNDALTSAT
jgi:lysophospholipase L1-like esterase